MQFNLKIIISYTLAIMLFSSMMTSVNAANSKKAFGYSSHYGVVTPTQAYAIIDRVNKALVYYSQNHKRSVVSKVKALKIRSVSGKSPEHVFVKLTSLCNAVDKLSRREQLRPMPRVTKAKAKAIPAEVFIQAGHNLDALIKYMNKVEPGNNWGRFYDLKKDIGAKSPSDVYAITDLAFRRLELIL